MEKRDYEKLKSELEHAIRERDAADFGRAISGQESLEINLCLGPGRCLTATDDSGRRSCPMCKPYPSGPNTASLAGEFLRVHVAGN